MAGRSTTDYSSSSSSSIDSSRVPYNHHHQQQPFINNSNNRDLSTDLRLGLSLSSTSCPNSRDDDEPAASDWPPIKSLLRSTLAENNDNGNYINNYYNINRPQQRNNRAAAAAATTFFVKVYMEGIPIGRKLDLFAHHGYQGLITTLTRMFRTTILYPGIDRVHSDQDHVLTYEDKEGDLMMVGDVPWDLFLSTVKRLKITRSDKC